MGESGCGKTTVARLILKLLEPDHGKIIFRGIDIGEFTEKEMKPIRKEIQIVFQDPVRLIKSPDDHRLVH